MANTLPRRIGFWSATAILVGTVIGAGIFRTPASITDKVPSVLAVLGLWVGGGLLALCGAIALAEVACAFPETGGIYIFIREGWGRLPAFLFGWAELVIIRAAQLGAVAIVFSEYLLRALGDHSAAAMHARNVHYIGAATIACVGWLNYRGVRWGTLLQNSMTIIKCSGLLALTVLALLWGGGHPGILPAASATVTPAVTATGGTLVPVGLALILVMWAYNGWAEVSFVAGEITDAHRNVPRVIVMGTLAVIVLYVLVNLAYFHVMPVEEVRHSPLVAADVATRLVGSWGAVVIGMIVMFSTLGTLNGLMLTGPRALWAMAHDGLLFKRLASVHPHYETPDVAILVTTAVAIAFALLRNFEQLASTVITAVLPFYILSVAAVFPLRRRPGYDPAFKTLGYPVTPILFILASLYLLAAAFVDPTVRLPTAAVFLVILAGIPLYAFLKKTPAT